MPNLILHVGPGKCGSSSIQNFFATQKRPCFQKTRYRLLNPETILELNCEYPCGGTVKNFTKLVSGNLRCDALILSHEILFQSSLAIKNICRLAKDLVANIFVIGFSRKQSDRMVSAYSQWSFRSPERAEQIHEALNTLQLEPLLFSGLEGHLIASIKDDFCNPKKPANNRTLDWFDSYKIISDLVHETGAVTKSGVLPNKSSKTSLIQDFCDKADLTLREEAKAASWNIANLKFNQDVVEAIYNAVALGMEMPGPHGENSALHLLSSKAVQVTDGPSEFFTNLKSYIDAYYFESNKRFCREYGLNAAYFEPEAQFTKAEILEIIVHEGRQRAMNKSRIISEYRILSARMVELCLKMIKDEKRK